MKAVAYPRLLALQDLAGRSEKQIRAGLESWGATKRQLSGYKVLVAYESVGDYGCDSSGYYLLENKAGKLLEVVGSHCSCMGFEGQFKPTKASVVYLSGPTFHVSTGGYDTSADSNVKAIEAYMQTLPKKASA